MERKSEMRRVIVNAGSLALLVGACALAVAATPPAVAAEETVTPPTEQAIIVAAEQPIVVVANEPVPRAAPRSAAAQEWPMPERPRVQIRKAARLAAAAKKRAAPSLIKMALRADFLSPHHVYRLVGVGFGF
jgi:hypothetical protein